MNEINNSPDCERASDLIAFLYNEASEHERRDFESHLKECRACSEEVASFGVVRESITTWRDEVLSGFVATPLPSRTQKKSALTALKQFFDLSPLWLKGAIGFALIALCALALLPIVSNNKTSVAKTEVNKEQVYTTQDVERMVREAVAKEQQTQQSAPGPDTTNVEASSKPKAINSASRMAKSRRPLTRAEREQLAADLRLLTTRDDVELHLLGERISQD